MDPALKRAVFSLEEGEISPPVDNAQGGGFHVFQVTRILDGRSFADCRDELDRELREREPDLREIEATVELLRAGADVQIFGSPVTGRGPAPEPLTREPGPEFSTGVAGSDFPPLPEQR